MTGKGRPGAPRRSPRPHPTWPLPSSADAARPILPRVGAAWQRHPAGRPAAVADGAWRCPSKQGGGGEAEGARGGWRRGWRRQQEGGGGGAGGGGGGGGGWMGGPLRKGGGRGGRAGSPPPPCPSMERTAGGGGHEPVGGQRTARGGWVGKEKWGPPPPSASPTHPPTKRKRGKAREAGAAGARGGRGESGGGHRGAGRRIAARRSAGFCTAVGGVSGAVTGHLCKLGGGAASGWDGAAASREGRANDTQQPRTSRPWPKGRLWALGGRSTT